MSFAYYRRMQAVPDIKAADLQRLGLSKPYSHQLLAGGKSPSLALAIKLDRELGIPVTAWPLPSKKPANDTAAQEIAA